MIIENTIYVFYYHLKVWFSNIFSGEQSSAAEDEKSF